MGTTNEILTEHSPERPHENTDIQKGKINVVQEIPVYIGGYILTYR